MGISWGRVLKHRMLDESDAKRMLGPGALERIAERVAASERRHNGEIRVCVEAGLPLSYLRRGASARERAVSMFGKLRVWDTEHNNGVLVYLLLADRAIEIVADRGVNRHVGAAEWQRIAATMQKEFENSRFEAGLDRAVAEVDALLLRHYALEAGQVNPNELPDAPALL